MKQDKETKNKLLASARTEFQEKGYANASLRNICRNAGVTTGALYFFFKDKADLYDSLVKDIVGTIFAVMHGHFAGESEQAEAGALGYPDAVDALRHFEDTEKVIHLMYEHRDDVLMLLTKSQGSSYEGVLDSFIETAGRCFVKNDLRYVLELRKRYKEIRNPYAQAVACLVFGMKGMDAECDFLYEEYKKMRNAYPGESYSDFPLLALHILFEK